MDKSWMTMGKTPDGRLKGSMHLLILQEQLWTRVIIFRAHVFIVWIAIDNLLILCVSTCFIVGLCNLTLIGIIIENLVYWTRTFMIIWLVLYLLSTTYTLGVVILIYWCGYSKCIVRNVSYNIVNVFTLQF